MSNTITAVVPKIIAAGREVLRSELSLTKTVNTDWGTEIAQKGDVITIPISHARTTSNVTPANVSPQAADTTLTSTTITLDQWKKADFFFTAKELNEFDSSGIIPLQLTEAFQAIGSTINQAILALFPGIYGHVGTGGTTPFGSGVEVKSSTDLRQELHQQRCPRKNRSMVLDYSAENAALQLAAFSDVDRAGDINPKIAGELGMKFGFDMFSDEDVPTHTHGTLTDGSTKTAKVNNGGGYAIGISTIAIDNTTLTGTIVVGDTFKFSGHNQGYVVTGNETASGNAIAAMDFNPPLVAAVADNEVLTFSGVAGAGTYVVNIGYHRNAFALAMRPPGKGQDDIKPNPNSMVAVDPVTGIPFRLQLIEQYNQLHWEVDVLYGVQLVQPAMAARLMG